jgi:hypothetical protein
MCDDRRKVPRIEAKCLSPNNGSINPADKNVETAQIPKRCCITILVPIVSRFKPVLQGLDFAFQSGLRAEDQPL